ncbi:MAG TPA: DUF2829 domain-containing protein [Anaerovoracaceae bacterium]|nr:DUF2829 domain-containing protein [Anaerovoracaceae bacterium]
MRYRKKPVVVEAIKWTGGNLDKVEEFVGESLIYDYNDSAWQAGEGAPFIDVKIKTLEGEMSTSYGDWIIKGVNGEFYPCKPDIFKKTYDEETGGMNFGQALELLKSETPIAREGWNGRGMFVVYQKGYPQGIQSNKQTAEAWGMQEGDLFRCEPYLQIKMVNGSHAMWVPSINDVLAEDWHGVEKA